MHSAECLVIGGGLAGAMSALRLAAAGRQVTLVEKERVAHHKVCGEFLSPEAIAYLSEAGIDPTALGAAVINRLRLSSGDRSVEADLPFSALSLSRCILDGALLNRASEQGVTVQRGVSVERLAQDCGTWKAGCSGGQVCRARAVFLATGKHDLRGWGRGRGAQNDLVGFKMHWRLAPKRTQTLAGAMELFFFPGGYGGFALIEEGIANLCLVVRRRALRVLGGWPEMLADLRGKNLRMRMYLDGAQPQWARPLAIASIPYGYLPATSSEVWRVGDQAAVIPSFTGDGMSIALHSGALAAEMYLGGRSADDYQHVLRRQLRRGMRLATFLSRVMVTRMGRYWALPLLSACPQSLTRIAQTTRVPEQAVLCDARKFV